jgi:hypothetical protein
VTTQLPQIDRALLGHEPPRPLPPTLLADLLGDRLLATPLRAYFDPVLVGCIAAALGMALLRTPVWLSWLVVVVAVLRLALLVWRFVGPALADARLLRNGIVVAAQVRRLRVGGTPGESHGGAYLDCVMPISAARSSVGSVWLASVAEAERLLLLGSVRVICLPRAPGTWRLLEGRNSEQRYEPSGWAEPEPAVDQ